MSQFDPSLAAGSVFESPPETVDRKVVVASMTKPGAKASPRDAACKGENEIGEQGASIYFRLSATLSQTPL